MNPFHGTRSDGFKLKEGRWRLDVRKKSLTQRVVLQVEKIKLKPHNKGCNTLGRRSGDLLRRKSITYDRQGNDVASPKVMVSLPP